MDYKEYNDNELLMYISENDEDANEIMYKKYYYVIRDYALKLINKAKLVGMDFNDLIQEGMLGLNIAINHYHEKENICFYTFACTCIKRKMISSIVKGSGKKNSLLNNSISFDYSEDDLYKANYILVDKNPLPEDIVANKIMITDLLQILNKSLSKTEKEILMLRIKGLKYKEISEKLNKSFKTIDNAIQRIRVKIKNVMKELN